MLSKIVRVMAKKKKKGTQTSDFVSKTCNMRNGLKMDMRKRPATNGRPMAFGFICQQVINKTFNIEASLLANISMLK